MYHSRKATDSRDKVYALLGMSLDDPDTTGLEADYKISWKDLFQKLVHLLLADQISVSIQEGDHDEVAVIEAKAYVLGKISSAKEGASGDDRQHVKVAWIGAPNTSDGIRTQSSHLTFQPSAKTIKTGDFICLVQGASAPTIFRLYDGFSTIIMVQVPPTDLPQWSASIASFPNNLLLIWNWDESRRVSYGGEDYQDLISSRGVTKCPWTECNCQGYMDKAARLWNFGLLMNNLKRYRLAVRNLRQAVEVYGIGVALRSAYPGHGPWREADEKTLRILDDVLIDDQGAAIEEKYQSHGQTPVAWAAEWGRDTVVRLLVESGADLEAKDLSGWVPLHWAAQRGHEAAVRLLAENVANINTKDDSGRTPLSWAAEEGHEAAVRLLAENGATISTKDNSNRTPLLWAAGNGHEAVVKLILATERANINVRDGYFSRTPLSQAAENGHEAVVKLLLATGSAEIDTKDNTGRTPLSWAAGKGHEAIVKLLLATGGADINARDNFGHTPLLWAAGQGHEAVAELLKSQGAQS